MGAFTFEDETTSAVAPAKLYKALVKDSDNLIPKVVDAVQGVEILEGNGGPGTVKKVIVVEGGETKHALHKIESVDEANFAYSYSIVGGAALPETAEKVTFASKFVAGPNGGSIIKLKITHHTKGDANPTEEEINIGKAKGNAFFKAIEAYLLANPDY
ncbi:hypothetical protein Fmac_013433 [Flemingia macrophylla]|uniref:Bet v I/Major latex protein domain-containing protein n=1 Tax=Flemingia macrophylla TaxID=520843 RepID=A0ABD1MTZ5_9FABA